MTKHAVVVTCLSPPKLLLGYARNFRLYNHPKAMFIIVGDKKTDNTACNALGETLNDLGVETHFLSTDTQRKLFPKKLLNMIPYYSDNRRNLGFFYAKMLKAKTIISLDDDNFITDNVDFLGGHSLKTRTMPCAVNPKNDVKWYNICQMLRLSVDTNTGWIDIYARGHPFNHRVCLELTHPETKKIKPVLNLGLWTSSPDVDAFTNIVLPKIFSYGLNQTSIALSPNVWCPVNSQNTCVDAKAISAYYFVKQKFMGLRIDRYGDIWQGYFFKKCAETMKDYITVGEPVVDHRRNQHNYLKDLEQELMGMKLTPYLTDWLEATILDGKTYEDCYVSLADKLQEWKLPFIGKMPVDKMKGQIAANMRLWVECMEEI